MSADILDLRDFCAFPPQAGAPEPLGPSLAEARATFSRLLDWAEQSGATLSALAEAASDDTLRAALSDLALAVETGGAAIAATAAEYGVSPLEPASPPVAVSAAAGTLSPPPAAAPSAFDRAMKAGAAFDRAMALASDFSLLVFGALCGGVFFVGLAVLFGAR